MKEIGGKTMVNFSHFRHTPFDKISYDNWTFRRGFLLASVAMHFSYVGGIAVQVGIGQLYLERLRTRALKSLEGFLMYLHNVRIGAIPSYRVYRLSDTTTKLQYRDLRGGYIVHYTVQSVRLITCTSAFHGVAHLSLCTHSKQCRVFGAYVYETKISHKSCRILSELWCIQEGS